MEILETIRRILEQNGWKKDEIEFKGTEKTPILKLKYWEEIDGRSREELRTYLQEEIDSESGIGIIYCYYVKTGA